MADRLAELRSAVADQVVQRASFLRFPDRTEMTVELRPPELGHVHLHLVDDRGSMTVRFNAHDPQAQQVLAGSMEHLAARLHDQGHSVQFDLAWEQREQRTTQDRDDEPGSLPQEQSEQNDDTPEAQVRTPAFSGNRGGRVDFRA
jgi:flagellar hook-length control protein FliK